MEHVFTSSSSLPVEQPIPIDSYSFRIDSRLREYAKRMFQIIVFPWGLYEVLHRLVGVVVFPSTFSGCMQKLGPHWKTLQKVCFVFSDKMAQLALGIDEVSAFQPALTCAFFLNEMSRHVREFADGFDKVCFPVGKLDGFERRPFEILVDGEKIFGKVLINPEVFDARRYTLIGFGNAGSLREHSVEEDGLILKKIRSHGVVFDRPGSETSTSFLPNRRQIAKAYAAVLHLMVKECGAEEIITYEHSISSGPIGDALQILREKQGATKQIKFLRIPHQTFGSLSSLAANVYSVPFFKKAVRFFGWDYNAKHVESELFRCIIAQNQGSDGLIPGEESLYARLVKNGHTFGLNRYHIVKKGHNVPYSQDLGGLEEKVARFFATATPEPFGVFHSYTEG